MKARHTVLNQMDKCERNIVLMNKIIFHNYTTEQWGPRCSNTYSFCDKFDQKMQHSLDYSPEI